MSVLYYSQILMAASASAYLYVCASVIGTDLSSLVYLASFTGTWAVYLFDCERGARLGEDRVSKPIRSYWFVRYAVLGRRAATILLAVTAALLLFEIHRLRTFEIILVVLALSLGYVFTLIPGTSGWYRLKDVPFFKSFVVVTGWVVGGVGIPLGFASRANLGEKIPVLFLLGLTTAALLFFDTLLLDYRDRNSDRQNGVVTLAQFSKIIPAVIHFGNFGLTFFLSLLGLLVPTLRPVAVVIISTAVCFGASAIYLLHWETDESSYGALTCAWRFVGALTAYLVFN